MRDVAGVLLMSVACGACSANEQAADDAGAVSPPDASDASSADGAADAISDSPSPPVRTVAFAYNDPTSANPAGVNHLYLMNVDSSGASLGASRLTPFAEPEDYPSWSPDGTTLLFVRGLDGAAIYRIDADGTNPQRLSPTPARDVNPSWSPDGTQIVFVRLLSNPPAPDAQAPPPQTEIHVMNADTSGDHVLLTSLLSLEPRWSVKNELVFMSFMNGANYDLFTMDLEGKNLRQLTKGQGNNADPQWSPDGTKISFGSDREGGGKLDVFVMNEDGSNQTALTRFDAPVESGDTNWSSDGAWIVFEHDIGGNKQSDPTAPAEVWIMASDGGAPTSTRRACSDVGCAPRFRPVK